MAFAKTAWSVVVGGRDGQPEQPRRTDAPAHPQTTAGQDGERRFPPAGHERCGRRADRGGPRFRRRQRQDGTRLGRPAGRP